MTELMHPTYKKIFIKTHMSITFYKPSVESSAEPVKAM